MFWPLFSQYLLIHLFSLQTIGGRGTQSAVMAIDSRENMFFGLMQDIAVASWNINTPYKRSNLKIVAQNSETLQFISGLKIKRTKVNTEELWVISNRFQVHYNCSAMYNIILMKFILCLFYVHSTERGNRDKKFTRNKLPDFRM